MLASHLKLALKVLRRRPFFTFVSLFGTCLTLVVLVVAAAVLDHLVGPLPPESRQDRSLFLERMVVRGDDLVISTDCGYAFLDRFARTLPGIERATIFGSAGPVTSYQGGRKTDLHLKRTDGEFWRVMEFRFLEGGPFTPEDEASARPVAVVNAATRRRLFDDRPAVGRDLSLDGQRFRVVGVVADVSFLRQRPFADVWVPLSTAKTSRYHDEYLGGFSAVILARRASDLPALQRAYAERVAGFQIPGTRLPPHRLETAADTAFQALARQALPTGGAETSAAGHSARLVAVLVVLALLFMLLPAINLVNLNLSRILERAPEIGVRKAFGATSGQLVGQFVLENVVLAVLGGLLGLALSALVLPLVSGIGLFPYATFALNHRVFAGGVLMAVVFGVVSGAYPAWRVSRLHPVQALRGSSR